MQNLRFDGDQEGGDNGAAVGSPRLLAAPKGLAATVLAPQKVMQLEVEGKINVSERLI